MVRRGSWDGTAWDGTERDGDAWGGPLSADPSGRRSGPAGRRRRGRRGRRVVKRLAITVVVLVVVLAAAIGVLWESTPSASEATQLAAQQSAEHGIAYPGPQPPVTFTNPLVATEDKRFYTESGVDPLAVLRLAWAQITGNASDAGGATLQQQLAKLLFTPTESGLSAEVKQVVLAYKLNGSYSKQEILRLYAEVAYYGHGYYGLEAASCGYFGHPAAELTPVQGAMLAGAVNAPTIDDPINDPEQANARLDHVISRMVAVGEITAVQGQQMERTSLDVVPRDQAGC